MACPLVTHRNGSSTTVKGSKVMLKKRRTRIRQPITRLQELEQQLAMVAHKLNRLNQLQLHLSKHQRPPMLHPHSQLSDVKTIVAFFDYQRL